MEHTKSSFYFTSKNDNWQVDYTYYIKNYYGQDHSELKVAVYLNNELYWDFEQKPYTKTVHSTQGQAKEIISIARKLYKENYKLRDDRDKKLSKLGINNS
jgi:hypothetical protein